MSKKAALVEDDAVLRQNFAELLELEGFEVITFAHADVLEPLIESQPDIILLDISLGNDSKAGFNLCRKIRQIKELTPIIFFTSRNDEIDRMQGLRLGADDYITKDMSLEFLVIRIKTLLRRVEILLLHKNNTAQLEQLGGRLKLYTDQYTATFDEQKLDLTLTQYWILEALVKARGNNCTHAELMRAANILVEKNTIAAHIKSIRQLFLDVDKNFSGIKTERGLGYRWSDT